MYKKSRFFISMMLIGLLLMQVTAVSAATYTVRPGDTLSSIAAQFGVSTQAIIQANDIPNPDLINPGLVLEIPDGTPSTPSTPSSTPADTPPPASSIPGTYTVQSGDSLSRIATQFGTNIFILAEANSLDDADYLFVGQVLTIPGGTGTAAPPVASDPAPAAPAPNTPPPAAPPPNPRGGYELGGQTHGFGNKQVMRDAGMTWVKFQHKWSPGDSPDAVAGRIQDAHNHGFKVLLSIPGSNTYPGPGGIDFNSYVAFLGGVAAHGPDAIEVWNEMNIDFEWPAGEISPSSYVNNMLKPAYNAIKNANSNVMVISGAPAPTGYDNNHNAWADDRYIAGMAAAGGANYMDCIGVHHNAGATSPSATSGHPAGSHYSWYYLATRDLYYNAFGGSRPVCFTELGYLSGDGFPGLPANFSWAGNTSVSEHAQWLAEAAHLSAASGRVRLLIIFNIDFTHYDPNGDPQAGYAMIRPDGSCPACSTLP